MSKSKILLVESSTIVLQIEKRCLKDAGVTIFTAASCDEALRVARKVRPDLIYLAYNLDGTDGVACCAALKSDPGLAGVPVVMVCSAAGEEAEGVCAGEDAERHAGPVFGDTGEFPSAQDAVENRVAFHARNPEYVIGDEPVRLIVDRQAALRPQIRNAGFLPGLRVSDLPRRGGGKLLL